MFTRKRLLYCLVGLVGYVSYTVLITHTAKEPSHRRKSSLLDLGWLTFEVEDQASIEEVAQDSVLPGRGLDDSEESGDHKRQGMLHNSC
jgi:hypothetical protein